MAQFKAFTANAEVNGETVLSIVDGMGNFKDRAMKFLDEQGIKSPEPGKWYSQQAWLNAFEAIAKATGDYTLFNIGKKIPENAKFPPQIDDIEKALSAIDVAYHMNHRINNEVLFNPNTGAMKEGIGHYAFEKTGERKMKLVCNNPYHCDFDRGIIDAMSQRFKPAGVPLVMVRHDDTQPCRKKGADSCTYLVSW
ncbi:MAG: hypothetical protein EPN93_02670 [Spirochaetes bacterium]|nr:MAG: hypothetical protein EPN93_02670 [Spirochaetota bacterium]